MSKKVLIAIPSGLLAQADAIAQVEHRNRSDLIREALRRYIAQARSDVYKAAGKAVQQSEQSSD